MTKFKATLWAVGVFIWLALGSVSTSVQANELRLQKVTQNIYAIVGPHEQRNASNFANNATFGVVVTGDGVVLIDPGGSFKGAAQIEALIKTITDKPVKVVINTGGQDHRWLGNGYFKARGARIIASSAAVEDHKERFVNQFNLLTILMGKEVLAGTEAVYAEETFEAELNLTFGGQKFELSHVGSAHTLGDAFVWMPEQKVMFTGDIVYVERMLGIGPAEDTVSWIETFETMADYEPAFVVPGHGPVTNITRATKETYDYLVYLRTMIGRILKNGGPIEEGVNIDQSMFSKLEVFDQISKRNAQAVYMQMEFE